MVVFGLVISIGSSLPPAKKSNTLFYLFISAVLSAPTYHLLNIVRLRRDIVITMCTTGLYFFITDLPAGRLALTQAEKLFFFGIKFTFIAFV